MANISAVIALATTLLALLLMATPSSRAATLFGPRLLNIGGGKLGHFGPLGYGHFGQARAGRIGRLNYGQIGGIYGNSFLGAANPNANDDDGPAVGSVGAGPAEPARIHGGGQHPAPAAHYDGPQPWNGAGGGGMVAAAPAAYAMEPPFEQRPGPEQPMVMLGQSPIEQPHNIWMEQPPQPPQQTFFEPAAPPQLQMPYQEYGPPPPAAPVANYWY